MPYMSISVPRPGGSCMPIWAGLPCISFLAPRAGRGIDVKPGRVSMLIPKKTVPKTMHGPQHSPTSRQVTPVTNLQIRRRKPKYKKLGSGHRKYVKIVKTKLPPKMTFQTGLAIERSTVCCHSFRKRVNHQGASFHELTSFF